MGKLPSIPAPLSGSPEDHVPLSELRNAMQAPRVERTPLRSAPMMAPMLSADEYSDMDTLRSMASRSTHHTPVLAPETIGKKMPRSSSLLRPPIVNQSPVDDSRHQHPLRESRLDSPSETAPLRPHPASQSAQPVYPQSQPVYPPPPGRGHGHTLSIRERARPMPRVIKEEEEPIEKEPRKCSVPRRLSVWQCFVYATTFFLCVRGDPSARYAFREKVALCLMIALMCGAVAFLTYGLPVLFCGVSDFAVLERSLRAPSLSFNNTDHDNNDSEYVWMFGKVYYWVDVVGLLGFEVPRGEDLSWLFLASSDSPCYKFAPPLPSVCGKKCLSRRLLEQLPQRRKIAFEWEDLQHYNIEEKPVLFVVNGHVLHYGLFEALQLGEFLGQGISDIVEAHLGGDATLALSRAGVYSYHGRCLVDLLSIGEIASLSPGCFTSQFVLGLCLLVIVGVVLARFLLAMLFDWFIAPTLTLKDKEPEEPLYTFLFMTVHSESEQSLRKSLHALAATAYPDTHKVMVVVADGEVLAKGSDRTTGDLVLSMMTLDDQHKNESLPYWSVAEDENLRYNTAKIYVGDWRIQQHLCVTHKKPTTPFWEDNEGHAEVYDETLVERFIPMVLIVKTGGSPSEVQRGNRGKRDSQLLFLRFLQRVLFDDRLSPLEYALFNAIYYLCGATPDRFEAILMVDGDTEVSNMSVKRLVSALQQDPRIMGLCGETRIANKMASWVTMIQVFEYYISHHLGKAFESMFGGVTCLPGCFCMYRIKGRRRTGGWIPLVASPDVLDDYGETHTATLHKKNLLLLGEDRFLTTLLLRAFPKRKLLFLPAATCRTIVPDSFRVLLSQRRRWINSTIHNLVELLKVRDLCGIFCCSMQFVVFMELVGTIVLPAAITFTGILLVFSFIHPEAALLPLCLLVVLLGSPAIFILLTTRKWQFVLWMLCYLVALPIWNFVLPVYAYWHFDDFSWGATQQQATHTGTEHKQSETISKKHIPLKRWIEWAQFHTQ